MIVCRTDRRTCDVRYSVVIGTYYCRLEPGHDGPHSCPAMVEDAH